MRGQLKFFNRDLPDPPQAGKRNFKRALRQPNCYGPNPQPNQGFHPSILWNRNQRLCSVCSKDRPLDCRITNDEGNRGYNQYESGFLPSDQLCKYC